MRRHGDPTAKEKEQRQVRRPRTAAAVGPRTTIGRRAIGLACLCLLALAAFAGPGTAAAAECPNEAIRIAQGATRLPDCRAYEQVSPADSAGGVMGVNSKNQPMLGAISADGTGAMFGSSSAVGEAERGSGLYADNLAHRTIDGWKSFGITTTTEPGVFMDASTSVGSATPSVDMSRVMFTTSRSLGPPNPLASGGLIYISAPEGKGAPTWLSRRNFESGQPASSGIYSVPLGGSPDLSSGYFRYAASLTNVAGDNLRTSTFGLYRFEGEAITPAGVLPSGMVSPKGAIPAGIGTINSSASLTRIMPEMARNQVSVDGARLFFVSPAEGTEPKQLYVEEGGAPGRLISHDVSGTPAPAGISSLAGLPGTEPSVQSGFAAATPDGSRVVFRSEAALTADAPSSGIKTYRAQITPAAITLTYLPTVDGRVLNINSDASEILFSVRHPVVNPIVPGESREDSLYVWDEDRPTAPYTLAANLQGAPGDGLAPESAFSADGDVLVFTSGAEVVPGIVPRAEVNYTQIYRWTRQGEAVTCISCRPDGGAPGRFGTHISNSPAIQTDNPAFPNGTPADSTQSSVVGNRKISSDGSRVFFDTNDPLDPVHDVNGTRDVYMWEDGKDYLLTSGRGDTPSLILDSSENGNDVMFVTRDGLVPSDTNGTYDVYDVRVDGGFVEPVKEGCEGAACQVTRIAPAAASPATLSVAGYGNQRQTKPGAVKVVQLGKPGKSARVRVEAPTAGQLKLTGNLIKNQGRSVKAKGAVKTTVALTRAGKKKLAAKGSLATKATATFRDREGRTKKSTVTLRFKQGGHR